MDELKNPLDAKSLKFMQRDAIEQITLQILPGMQPDGFKNPREHRVCVTAQSLHQMAAT